MTLLDRAKIALLLRCWCGAEPPLSPDESACPRCGTPCQWTGHRWVFDRFGAALAQQRVDELQARVVAIDQKVAAAKAALAALDTEQKALVRERADLHRQLGTSHLRKVDR